MKELEPIRYTGTVNIWTDKGIINSAVLFAWQEFQTIPSYVERFKIAAEYEKAGNARLFRGDPCLSCNYIVCQCEE
jgi:hypothetical protein